MRTDSRAEGAAMQRALVAVARRVMGSQDRTMGHWQEHGAGR
jgi:hypothetical protein